MSEQATANWRITYLRWDEERQDWWFEKRESTDLYGLFDQYKALHTQQNVEPQVIKNLSFQYAPVFWRKVSEETLDQWLQAGSPTSIGNCY